ncbi:MAG: CoB--CoM heterodisulfide reductase iron-sulfur subunit B family protein [Desulfobacterales bacterium]
MKTFAIQRCCSTPVFLKQYETSTDAVLRQFGVDVIDIRETGCCGYPLKNINVKAFVLSSARNLALAEKKRLDMITFCNCCYGSLKHVDHLLKSDTVLASEINTKLKKEKLTWQGRVAIRHLLDVLYEDIGLETIRGQLVNTFKNLNIATHYGCHLLRPLNVVGFDNPFSPSKFDQLIELTGAVSIPWSSKLECCGSPLWGVNDALSAGITRKKVKSAVRAGADFLCTACPYCQLQFDRVRRMTGPRPDDAVGPPSVLYTQLLGLCLGLGESSLGIGKNEMNCNGLLNFLTHSEQNGGVPQSTSRPISP